MPELPEVETTRLGLVERIVGRRIRETVVREPRLRWPVPSDLASRLRGTVVRSIQRRGKYLLLDCGAGYLLVHLGMSGRLTVVPADRPLRRHDHVDITFEGGDVMRFNDPRRFGAMLWVREPAKHALLKGLGVEPLEDAFSGELLYALSRGRRVPVKQFVMDARIVTGIGNIYANEALARAGIHPLRRAESIAPRRIARLATEIHAVLEDALTAGGTTLADGGFADAEGASGTFAVQLSVYGREGAPCTRCGSTLRRLVAGNRSVFFCPRCQR
jgi:formamidopyrimidine-DNA glycosylase